MTLDVCVDSTERCFDLPEWHELLARDPHGHVFATPEWNRVWWEEFGAGKDLFLLTLYRGPEVAAIVPLCMEEQGGRRLFRFMGGTDLTDYMGPICSIGDRWHVADALVRWLTQTDVQWDELDAHNMPVPFGFAEFLVERSDAYGLTFTLDQEETSAVLVLPSDWASFESALESKERHELRRKRRRLAKNYSDAKVRSATDQTLDDDLRIFIDMHRGAQGMKGHFMRPEIATFFERIAKAFMLLGWLRLELLQVGDEAIASTFGFHCNDTYSLYNSAYEPQAARLSPGFVLVSELVKGSIEGGLKHFDFLRGPERYKYQLGAQAVPLNNVRVLNDRTG